MKNLIEEYLDLQLKYEKIYGNKTIVIMEVGSFYEIYGLENIGKVREITELLNITMTRRDKRVDEVTIKNPYMAGFNSICLSKFLRVLLDNNYTVVKVDQVTDPPNPKREITQIYSPSTSIDEYNSSSSNYIVCLYIEIINQINTGKDQMCIGLSAIDLMTGENIVYEVYDNSIEMFALQEAYRFIQTYSPKEIIVYCKNDNYKDKIIDYLELETNVYYYYNTVDYIYSKISYQTEFLEKIFDKTGLLSIIESLDLEMKEYARLSYILILQFSYEHDNNIIRNIKKPIINNSNIYLKISNNALQQLDYNLLYNIINKCSTAMGRRFLRKSIMQPILDTNELNRRYDDIEILMKDDIYKNIEFSLKNVFDIERLHRKMSLENLHPSEFCSIDISYRNISKLLLFLKENNINNLLPQTKIVNSVKEFTIEYEKYFNIDELRKYSLKGIEGYIFNRDICKDIDKIQDKLNEYHINLKILSSTISNYIEENTNYVKVDKTDKEGYYLSMTSKRFELFKQKCQNKFTIEINNDRYEILLSDFKIKKLNNSVKITSDFIDQLSNKIISSTDLLRRLSKKEYLNKIVNMYHKYKNTFNKVIDFVSYIDFIKSNSKLSLENHYCKPKIDSTKNSFMDIKSLRHPIAEKIHDDVKFISNDVSLNSDDVTGMLITGLNGVGKSVLIKSVALSIIMAQTGMYVPADEFSYNIYHHLFTRIGNSDNLLRGQSTFVKEMTELNTILKYSNEKTFIIADELCSGSEHYSAQSILAATILMLSKKKSNFMFTTHFHGVFDVKEIEEIKNVDFYYLDVEFNNNNLVYNRKLKKGKGDKLYGIEVARCIIDNDEFITLSNKIRTNILSGTDKILSTQSSHYNSDIYIDHCGICNKRSSYDGELDVHHIRFQNEADKNNYIDYYHKNSKFNLVVLCKEHHKMVHNNKIKINGWLYSTDKGRYLDYEFIEKEKKNKKSKSKYTDEQIEKIKLLKGDFLTNKQAVEILESKYKIKTNAGTVTKYWNQMN